MASAKDLKKRIGTVKNTQQTTRAMKMVSAAKLRRAQEAILCQRPYARQIDSLIRVMKKGLEAQRGATKFSSPLLGLQEREDAGKDRLLVLVVSSDRGLCGGFNANIIKTASRFVEQNVELYETIDLCFLGKKAHDFFKYRKVKTYAYFEEFGGKASFFKAKELTKKLIGPYLDKQFDKVVIIYNEFKNAVSQKVVVEQLLPLGELVENPSENEMVVSDYIVKPSSEKLLSELLEKHFAVQVYRIMLESQAGEHGARMSAMENATKNAGEMIKRLTLQYNRERQAGITKELLEIISGSEAQKTG